MDLNFLYSSHSNTFKLISMHLGCGSKNLFHPNKMVLMPKMYKIVTQWMSCILLPFIYSNFTFFFCKVRIQRGQWRQTDSMSSAVTRMNKLASLYNQTLCVLDSSADFTYVNSIRKLYQWSSNKFN